MLSVEKIKWSLVTLAVHEPEWFKEEIKEIFECIFENKPYDEAPALQRSDLIAIIEYLGHSDITRLATPSQSEIESLKNIGDSSHEISNETEAIIKSKIRNILLGC